MYCKWHTKGYSIYKFISSFDIYRVRKYLQYPELFHNIWCTIMEAKGKVPTELVTHSVILSNLENRASSWQFVLFSGTVLYTVIYVIRSMYMYLRGMFLFLPAWTKRLQSVIFKLGCTWHANWVIKRTSIMRTPNPTSAAFHAYVWHVCRTQRRKCVGFQLT